MTSKADRSSTGLFGNFKRLFMRGLAALLPTLVTIAILIWAYEFVNTYIGKFIAQGCIAFLARVSVSDEIDASHLIDAAMRDAQRYGEPTSKLDDQGRYVTREYERLKFLYGHQPESPELRRLITDVTALRLRAGGMGMALSVLGFVVAILLVWVLGFFLASFFGRRTWLRIEAFSTQMPLVKAIYPHVKQVTDFLLTERRLEISGVVAVQYPRNGVWSVGLLTGQSMAAIAREVGASTVSVFIPSSPTPFTGYVITVPRTDVLDMPISIDDALKFTVSGGVIVPGSQQAVFDGREPSGASRPLHPPDAAGGEKRSHRSGQGGGQEDEQKE